jgi:hypothetical protein
VDPRAGLDDVEKRKFLPLPELELRPLARPARSQSLYRLRYPGSFQNLVVFINSDGQISKYFVFQLFSYSPYAYILSLVAESSSHSGRASLVHRYVMSLVIDLYCKANSPIVCVIVTLEVRTIGTLGLLQVESLQRVGIWTEQSEFHC